MEIQQLTLVDPRQTYVPINTIRVRIRHLKVADFRSWLWEKRYLVCCSSPTSF